MGICDGDSEILTYYDDDDGDGLGNGNTELFCSGDVPIGWVLKTDDEDDY